MGQAALIGAGLGAATSALTGRSPIKGALLGGAGGGLFGGASNLMNTGSVLGASPVGAQVAQNALLGAPQATGNWAMIDGTLTNMDYYKNVLGTPVFTGGQGVFSNALDMASNSVPSFLKENLTPSNLAGVQEILSNQNRTPMPGVPSSGARAGSAPQSYNFPTGTLVRRRG